MHVTLAQPEYHSSRAASRSLRVYLRLVVCAPSPNSMRVPTVSDWSVTVALAEVFHWSVNLFLHTPAYSQGGGKSRFHVSPLKLG